MAAEQLDHLRGLAQPQQSVVDEDAGELLADGLVDQHRRDRGIDAARQAADHLAASDLGADLLDRLLLEGAHGPVALQPAMLRTKLRRIAAPCGVWTTSRWNWVA